MALSLAAFAARSKVQYGKGAASSREHSWPWMIDFAKDRRRQTGGLECCVTRSEVHGLWMFNLTGIHDDFHPNHKSCVAL
eukprot:2054911-Amphidinium_carterae.1